MIILYVHNTVYLGQVGLRIPRSIIMMNNYYNNDYNNYYNYYNYYYNNEYYYYSLLPLAIKFPFNITSSSYVERKYI